MKNRGIPITDVRSPRRHGGATPQRHTLRHSQSRNREQFTRDKEALGMSDSTVQFIRCLWAWTKGRGARNADLLPRPCFSHSLLHLT